MVSILIRRHESDLDFRCRKCDAEYMIIKVPDHRVHFVGFGNASYTILSCPFCDAVYTI